MTFIQLSAVEKSFGTAKVVQGFDLDIARGEFVSLLGPSGCGKTTVLRMVAGFETPESGDIVIDGKSVLRQRANQRNIGMVFQSYALFPNLTVAGNIAFGLTVAGMDRAAIRQRVGEMLEMVGLSGYDDRYPTQLSGGQQQRVALARAVAPRPRVLLLDEPLSALDAKIRVSLRTEIRAIQRHLGITTLFVTHDQEEALAMSDRIVVMNKGRAEQIGTPQDIYAHPRTRFVAEFIGTLNVLEARIDSDNRNILRWSGGQIALATARDATQTADLRVAIRPESLRPCPAGQGQLDGILQHVEYLGSFTRLHIRCADRVLYADTFARDLAGATGLEQPIGLSLDPQDVMVLAD